MKELVLPVPETVSASYTVPVPEPVSTAEARRLAGEAIEARLTGPLRTLTAAWLAEGAVKVKVGLAGPLPPGLLDRPLFGSPEQRAFLTQARAFVQFNATQRASLIAMQEWKARGPAAALAAGIGAPVLDSQALQVLTAEEALAALPGTALTIPASFSHDVTVGLTFKPWVSVHDVDYLGVMAVITDGMRRFGLPELRMGPASPDLREELTALLNGVAFRIWSGLLARAQETPNGTGLEDSRNWLTVCPPTSWEMSWEDFIADTCHAMFGFDKPRWHYIPEFGALLDAVDKAIRTLPEARSRFLRDDLPPGGRLMARYETAKTGEVRWASVTSWEEARHAVVRDTGRELAPGARPGHLATIETEQIVDWGIWVDGKDVIEGCETEGIGHHLS